MSRQRSGAAIVHESNTLSQLDHGFIELLQTLGGNINLPDG